MELERIDENERVATTDNGKYFVRRVEGHELWTIVPNKGPVPKMLQGMYTTPTYAYNAITNYLITKKKV